MQAVNQTTQRHVESVTVTAEDVGVHVYGVACHRMHVLSGASLAAQGPGLGKSLKGQASQAFVFPFLGCDSGLRGGMTHRNLGLTHPGCRPLPEAEYSPSKWPPEDQTPPGKR